MADIDGFKASKEFYLDREHTVDGFHVKGMQHNDWGMKQRLSHIFNKDSGKTVMLAFDHGYIMGPTSGLERLDIVIEPLLPYVDVLMANRGGIKTSISPTVTKALCLRTNHDATVLHDDLSIGSGPAVSIEDAIRLNAQAVAVQTFIGGAGEKESLDLLCKTVNEGNKYGIPVMGVVAVGKEMERTPQFFMLATRVLAELGAHIVKSYYCEDFDKVVAACPVPIVIAGGKKLPEKEALTLAYNAISDGAAGVDMGRNIFQSECPAAMAQAIQKVVHYNYTDEEAYAFYLETKADLL